MLAARSMVQGRKRPVDERVRWAAPERDRLTWEELTKGEQRRRVKFCRLVSSGVHADVAVREVLELELGPVPGVQTEEEFEAAWGEDRVAEIALRWVQSPHFRAWAKDQTEVAREHLRSWSMKAATVLRDVAEDSKASPTARVKASQILLGLAGLVAGEKPQADVRNLKEMLRRKTRAIVEGKKPVAVEAETSSGDGEG